MDSNFKRFVAYLRISKHYDIQKGSIYFYPTQTHRIIYSKQLYVPTWQRDSIIKIYYQLTKIMFHIIEYVCHNACLLSRFMQWLANLKALLQSHEPYKLNAVNGSFHFILHWNANAPGDRVVCWIINMSKFLFFFPPLTPYVYNHSPNVSSLLELGRSDIQWDINCHLSIH